MIFDNIHLKKLRDGVYEAIKAAILRGELPPGHRLIEKELVSEIRTSRTPIREAIIKLEQEGLIERTNGKTGYFVSSMGRQQVEDLFGVREVLENYSIGLAIERISGDEIRQLDSVVQEEEAMFDKGDVFDLIELDTKFHEILYRASKNRKLHEILGNLKDHLYRYRTLSFRLRKQRNIALSNHRELVMAIKNKDRELARKLTLHTISRSREVLLDEITD